MLPSSEENLERLEEEAIHHLPSPRLNFLAQAKPQPHDLEAGIDLRLIFCSSMRMGTWHKRKQAVFENGYIVSAKKARSGFLDHPSIS